MPVCWAMRPVASRMWNWRWSAARIGGDQHGQDGFRCLAGAQPRHAVDRVHRVDQRLGCQGADTAFDERADGADGKETGGDGDANCAGRGIAGEDGPGHGGEFSGNGGCCQSAGNWR
jgi:hypothetical protein